MNKKNNGKYTYQPPRRLTPIQRWFIFAGIACLSVLILITAAFFLHRTLYTENDFLQLSTITINAGNQQLKNQINEFLIEQNVTPGSVTLPCLELSSLRTSLLEHFPLVDSLKITRRFPGTLIVEVSERQAVAILRYTDSKRNAYEWKIDQNGIVLPPTATGAQGIPIVNGIEHPETLVIGEKTTNKGVLAFLKFLEEKELRPEGGIYEVTICRLDENNEEMTLVLNAKGPFKASARIVLPQKTLSQAMDNLQVIVKLRLEKNETISYVNATYDNIPVKP